MAPDEPLCALKDRVALRALDDAPLHGWSMDALRRAAAAAGQDARMADALFPRLADATAHVSDLFDRRMMEQLRTLDADAMRVRERIAAAVMTRLDLMAPHHAGLRVALAHWAQPMQAMRAGAPLWRSADRIWAWAGDTARDYNRYTKRGLLAGVMAATTLFWLQDNSPGMGATRAFLDRRIDNVLAAGRFIGSLRKKAA